jgi:hypothetical protein
MSTRQTLMWIGLWGGILLLSNTAYFSHGFHRFFTWPMVCLDVASIVFAIFAFTAAKRRP